MSGETVEVIRFSHFAKHWQFSKDGKNGLKKGHEISAIYDEIGAKEKEEKRQQCL